jgi:acetyl esterase
MAIDEATQQFLTTMAELGLPPLRSLTPVGAREMGEQLMGPPPVMAPMHSITEERLTSRDGQEFELRILAPVTDPAAVIVYLHGGGWVTGNIDGYEAPTRQLAELTGSTVILINYRKAPESPYPGPVEDSWQALQWVKDHMDELAGRTVPLIVAGDSAGGNLAAVVAQRAAAQGGPRIDLQVLIYPVTDFDPDRESYHNPENQLMLDRETMLWFWDHYAPLERRTEPEASPLRAPSLAGLPPTVIAIAEHDPLHDEGRAYADALRSAGVPVEEKLFTGQMHGFLSMYKVLPASEEAIEWIADRVTSAIGRQVQEVQA